MEKYIAGKRSMECKQKQLGGLVRNKIKNRKSTSLVKRTIEILPSGVRDFPILYSPRC